MTKITKQEPEDNSSINIIFHSDSEGTPVDLDLEVRATHAEIAFAIVTLAEHLDPDEIHGLATALNQMGNTLGKLKAQMMTA